MEIPEGLGGFCGGGGAGGALDRPVGDGLHGVSVQGGVCGIAIVSLVLVVGLPESRDAVAVTINFVFCSEIQSRQ